MFYIKDKNYSKGFILISLLILFSIYMSILRPINDYNSSRIYDLKAIPEIYRVSLLKKFLDKQYVKNSILILGDSQPNGYMYPTKDIFSSILSKQLNKKVINAAFPDESITDNLYALEYLKSKNMHFETIIFNINHSHPQKDNHHHLDLNESIDYKIGILEISNTFKYFPNKFNPKTNPGDAFYQYPKLENYFNMPNKPFNLYLLRVKKLITLAKSISQRVIIYETAHCLEDVRRLKLNEVAEKKLGDKVANICQENNVTFLRTNITEKKYFKDIVHFNTKGHIKMAEILYNEIKN